MHNEYKEIKYEFLNIRRPTNDSNITVSHFNSPKGTPKKSIIYKYDQCIQVVVKTRILGKIHPININSINIQ